LDYGLEKSTGDIIIYTTCDVIISPKLLVDISKVMKPSAIVIPHPYPEMPYGAQEKEYLNYMLEDPTNTGIDIFAFSKESARVFSKMKYLKKHTFLGWGMFDHLIIAGAIQLRCPIVKLSAVDSTIKFHNDRNQNSETNSWMEKCHAYNVIQFRKYVRGNLRFLPLLSLRVLHQTVEKNRISITQLLNLRGLKLIRAQTWFLLKNLNNT
jgi:hypothetical protein